MYNDEFSKTIKLLLITQVATTLKDSDSEKINEKT